MAVAKGHSPLRRTVRLLASEKADLAVLFSYATAVAILILAVPLAVQALVNTIATGLFVQPVVILSALVFGGLVIAGGLQLAGIGVVELLQRRLFVRTTLEVTDRILRMRADAVRGSYAPEVVNRFFDVLTVQKTLSKVLVDGIAAGVQAAVAAIVLGVFSPYLLLATAIVLVLFAITIILLGLGGTESALRESTAKYRLVGDLEDLARCHVALKVHGDQSFFEARSDAAACEYLDHREDHFEKVRRQLGATFLFVALANAAILSVGGALVLSGQLTLGSVVAAQLIVSLLMTAFDKLVRHAESYYDLLASLTKLSILTDLPTERTAGKELPAAGEKGAKLDLSSIDFAYTNRPVIAGLDLSLSPGDRASLVGASGAGKSTIAALIAAIETPSHGMIEMDGMESREVSLKSWRSAIGLAGGEREIFAGTLSENILCGREELSSTDVRRALSIAAFDSDLVDLPAGLETPIVSGGRNLSGGQIQRILLARAIVTRPRLLILDEIFAGIDEQIVSTILDRLFDSSNPWTILDISHDPEVVRRSSAVYVLADGRIVTSGTPSELAKSDNGEFARLFPLLALTLRNEPSSKTGAR